jgi:pimeloyl-ACP methyl ester carboxylesterase
MRRWVKVLLIALAAIVVLLVLNAIALSNQTEDAHVNVEGAELIETSNGTLQVLDEGDPQGSPIVLIHGYSASMNWFEKLAPLLAENHRVIRVDLLGHGGSEKPSAGYEIADQANAVAEALAQLDVSNATVVGHSLGGSVATALAEQSRDLATKVVILDQAPDDSYGSLSFTAKLGYVPVIGQAVQRMADIGPDSVVRDQYKQAFAPGFNMACGFENPDQVVDDLRAMTYTAYVDVADGETDYSDARSLSDRLSAMDVPLLVIFGAEDQIVDSPEESIQPYRDIPRAQTELLEGVGHSPNVEAPERTAALIEAFIARTEKAEAAQRRADKINRAEARQERKAAVAARRAKLRKKAAERKAAEKKAQQKEKASK